jgi:hypothetical protein
MTCKDMDGVFNSQCKNSALPPQAAEHIVRCERCQEVMRVLVEGPEARQPSERRMKLIRASLLRDLRPVRPLPSAGVFLAGCAASFLAVAILGVIQLQAYGWHVLNPWQTIVVLASLALGACSLALSMTRQMRPGSEYSVSPNLLPGGVLQLVAVAMAAVFHSQKEQAFVFAHPVQLQITALIGKCFSLRPGRRPSDEMRMSRIAQDSAAASNKLRASTETRLGGSR